MNMASPAFHTQRDRYARTDHAPGSIQPAFPGGSLRFDDGDCHTPFNSGMTLRDWFAGQALALHCNSDEEGFWRYPEFYRSGGDENGAWLDHDAPIAERAQREAKARAKWAYELADALLAAREKPND